MDQPNFRSRAKVFSLGELCAAVALFDPRSISRIGGVQ